MSISACAGADGGTRLSGRFWEENWGKSHYDFFQDRAEYWMTGSGILWTADYSVDRDQLEICPRDETWCKTFVIDGDCIRRVGAGRYCLLDYIRGGTNGQ